MEIPGKFQHLARPALSEEYISGQRNICFMNTDVDYYIDRDHTTGQEQGIIRLYGVTEEGHSVVAHVHSFESYFWAECPRSFETEEHRAGILDALNGAARANMVSRIEVEERESIMFYTGEGKKPFYKIYTHTPKHVAALRGMIERGVKYRDSLYTSQTFESNVPFALRFMIDTGVTGMCWIELPCTSFNMRNLHNKVSRAQLEVDINYREIIVHKPEGIWSKIAPLRILSFDLECSNDGVNFPTPDKNEVIQIGNVCKLVGHEELLTRAIFTLDTCGEIPEADVYSYQDEKSMLTEWNNFVNAIDPDIMTGYNILNFDYPYLFKRAETLKLRRFPYFGRITDSETRIKDSTFQSKAQGIRDTKEITMEGRVQLDMLQHIQREHKLSQYSLNSVSITFLREQKEDVHWAIMKQLQEGNEETRRRIAVYCLKDCHLPLRLVEKLMCIYNYTEMARVTGVPFSYLCIRGQQIKVTSQLLRKASQTGMLIPTQSRGEVGDKFEGAFVLDPKKGYYDSPIVTLDFASLYPSIMMAHNLCYCTLVPPSMAHKFGPDKYETTPSGDKFVTRSVREGILPMILQDLINARKKAREELRNTTDPFMQKVLDGRQLALKITANSVYGFTGAQVGQLPCLNISSSVTAYGRMMIEQTKKTVEEHYSHKNATVIYGDTDSVMINFNVATIQEAMELGREASQFVTQQFVAPIKLEFEKVYFPYLLMAKKRYCGLLWTRPDKYDKLDAKGIESVRRDNCALVRDTINACLHMLLVKRDVNGAIEFVKNTISALLQNKVDLSLLVITKALGKRTQTAEGKSSKNTYTAKQAHVELAQRMQQRDSANAPSVGDRIAYVMLKGVKGQKAYELAEDPIYVLQNDLPLDFEYYLEKQLKLPLTRLFDAILPNPNILFTGEHTRKRYQPKIASGALSKFIKVANTCLGCKTQIKSGMLCSNCEHKAGDLYIEKILQMNNYERNFSELWTECQRCQGSVCQEVLCTNRDCPIFYRREKVKKDIETLRVDLDKFPISW